MSAGVRMASAGEALVDLFPEEDGQKPVLRIVPGGSSFNVAIGLARLGLDVSFAGRLSTDVFGRRLASVLGREGIGREFVQYGPEPTALAIVEHDGADARYDFRWRGTADREFDPEAIEADSFERLDALHVGSVALGIEPVGARLEALMERSRGRVFLTFDPNVRVEVVDDWPTYVARVRRVAQLADLVKVSHADLAAIGEAWSPGTLPFGRNGPTIVTAGAGGATLLRAGAPPLHVPAEKLSLVDTVGAGDATSAALLYALVDHGAIARGSLDAVSDEVWNEVMRVIMMAGAMTCERVGADPPTRAALRTRLGRG